MRVAVAADTVETSRRLAPRRERWRAGNRTRRDRRRHPAAFTRRHQRIAHRAQQPAHALAPHGLGIGVELAAQLIQRLRLLRRRHVGECRKHGGDIAAQGAAGEQPLADSELIGRRRSERSAAEEAAADGDAELVAVDGELQAGVAAERVGESAGDRAARHKKGKMLARDEAARIGQDQQLAVQADIAEHDQLRVGTGGIDLDRERAAGSLREVAVDGESADRAARRHGAGVVHDAAADRAVALERAAGQRHAADDAGAGMRRVADLERAGIDRGAIGEAVGAVQHPEPAGIHRQRLEIEELVAVAARALQHHRIGRAPGGAAQGVAAKHRAVCKTSRLFPGPPNATDAF